MRIMLDRSLMRPVKYALLATLTALASPTYAAWPERPVTVIVPFAPGGITDILARMIAEDLQDALKQTFVIENVTGASGLIATQRAARAQPVPVLRLTLLDRYGKRIAARDLLPAEYWPHGQSARSFLAHDERIDSEIAVRDPGADSASFEIDVCLTNVRGAIHCASELANPAAGSS